MVRTEASQWPPDSSNNVKTAALILAAGKSRRFNDSTPKQFHKLGGVELLVRSVKAFTATPQIDCVAVVVDHDLKERSAEILSQYGLSSVLIIPGGRTRQESAVKGLEALQDKMPNKVVIHDSARPLFKGQELGKFLPLVQPGVGIVVGKPASDTIYSIADDLVKPLERDTLWIAETPQCFMFEEILAAHRSASQERLHSATDDAQLYIEFGGKIAFYHYVSSNLKITYTEDLEIAEVLLYLEPS